MSGFTFLFSHSPIHRIDTTSRLRLATVSFLALSAALSAGPTRADCTTSTDGLDMTCSGDVGTLDFTLPDTTADQTAKLTIQDVTNTQVSNGQNGTTPIWTFEVTSPQYSQTSAGAVLDIDGGGLQMDATGAPAIEATALGSPGQWHSETKGSGEKVGRDGGVGGGGGSVTATISGLDVTASDEAIVIRSEGAYGGHGAEGYSTAFADGYGGDGGTGGSGGPVTVTLTDSTLNQGAGLVVVSSGSHGGTGGTGKAAEYNAYGGDGGTGGHGGNVIVHVANLTTDGQTGIAVVSHGEHGGEGGVGENTLNGTGHGGTGGMGGHGGGVLLNNTTDDGTGAIQITATSGPGILAESIAGDGGDGGQGLVKGYFGHANGGDGGQGGTGGSVTVEIATADDGTESSITVKGDLAPGIVARSYGGAGGAGGHGNAVSGNGGAGAGSGPAGGISVTYGGDISTDGSLSDGILAQSVGGFSGDAGESSGIVAYGASSQSAGGGGNVTVIYNGTADTAIRTTGDDSDGIFAQSQGGGGGKASSTMGLVSLSGDETGSSGGNGGPLSVTASGVITTSGTRSRGVVAQSVGGTGGDGGNARGFVGIGGTGSNGGQGGNVLLTSTADITTMGDDSIAILAQSVGGGGGSAGSTAGIVAIGGDGGEGSTGGVVSVEVGGDISTAGTGADGVVAQSIGGSGGHGSNTLALSVGFSLAIAGNGGAGADGGRVDLATVGGSSVATKGDNARGVSATSVGGGGGYGGNAISVSANDGPSIAVSVGGSGKAGGAGGEVTLNSLGSVSTEGDNATAVSALSVGGAGGAAGTTVAAAAGVGTVSLGVGGNGGGGGDGGLVTVCRGGDASDATCSDAETAGSIQTSGDGAVGLYASSVGGGGGQSGAVVSGTAGEGAAISIGGDGGTGGEGGDVTVYSSGGIVTTGESSGAIVVSSIGGSGGDAHIVGAFGVVGESGLNIGVGGSGGSALGSGDVVVTSTDTIQTSGTLSAGIQATSQAGGGGSGSGVFSGEGVSTGSANISIGGAGGGGGTAGDVTVTWTGDTLITGDEQSPGIYALSAGGSGGNAGMTFSGEGVGLVTTAVSIGAEGGAGGTAGTASVTAGGQIQTSGFMSDGIAAVSHGGNGGRGGLSITGTGISQGDAAVTLGGGGGTGGTAGTATVETLAGASISTDGPAAAGINVLSLGGNGGQGGMAVETGMNVDFDEEIPVGSADFTMGGSGGTGGAGGLASVTNRATIVTGDFNSAGIQSQSIGGSGGSGGMAVSGTLNFDASQSIGASITLGGAGGAGGAAGTSEVTNFGAIRTLGDNSSGILSQSIGGSGGAGGLTYNILTNVLTGGTLNLQGNVSIGGDGGDGGIGGASTVTNSAAITTVGTSSSGIYAQSVGGNGGKGGFGGTGIYSLGQPATSTSSSSIGFTLNTVVGGNGGDGAVGGAVTVTNDAGGTISTGGGGAYGIFAQSVGGNGGDGGLASNFSQSVGGDCEKNDKDPSVSCVNQNNVTTKVSATLNVEVGGDGGAGADAGTATVTNDADITTKGDVAHGIFSQSVGGGGGNGGATASTLRSFTTRRMAENEASTAERARSLYTLKKLQEDFGTVNVRIGGQGGAAGDGETSSVTNSGAITTSGTNSYGIFSQSIGGGGGSGGEAADITDSYMLELGGNGAGGGDGGTVGITNSGAITTSGYGSAALLAQSIGGGGGNTGSSTGYSALYDVNLAVGGRNGAAGDGGDVTVVAEQGTITTASEQSPGIFAQSVGGGGGTLFGGTGTLTDDASEQVEVGGTGKASGDGGAVTVTASSDISTGPATPGDLNAASIGIFAQSVGGGGGYSGSMILGDHDRIGIRVLDTSADATGNGGAVTVDASGRITTSGDNSVGIFAQSVGGGGGVQGTVDKSSTDSAYVGSFSGTGTAGVVTVTYSGAQLSTTGAGAHGIFAQFAGGEGNASAVANTTVDVTVTGNVSATGAGAHAIHVENMGSGGGHSVITVGENAAIRGGTHAIYDNALTGAGVLIHSGSDSTLNNAGTISAVSGVAIHSYGGGTLTLNNTGTVTGSILGTQATSSGTSAAAVATSSTSSILVENMEDGVLNAGEILDVASLSNWGQIYVGEAETLSGTRITGDFLHNAGTLSFDVNMADSDTDLLTVDGRAELHGALEVNVLQASQLPTGIQTLTIVEASGGVDASDLDLIPSVVARYQLEAASATELTLSYEVDYANDTLVAALNDNQGGLTTYFNKLYELGELDDGLAETLIEVASHEDYAVAMNTLGPELATSNGIARLYQTLRFADGLFSCPHQGQGNVWADDGQCGYLTFGANRFDRDATGGASGFTQDGLRIAMGGQMLLDSGFALGAALAYDSTSLSTDTGATSDGDTFSGGLSVKRFVENWEFGAAIHTGYGSFDNTRIVGTEEASGDQDQWVTGAQLRAGYTFDQGNWFLKPRLDLGVTHFGDSSYTESGSGTALAIETSAETFAYLRPALEIGGSYLTSKGTEIRPNAVLAVTQFLGNTSFDARARLADAPGSVAPFDWQSDIDRTQFDLSAGVTIMTAGGGSFDISAFGHLTSNERDYGGVVRWNMPF